MRRGVIISVVLTFNLLLLFFYFVKTEPPTQTSSSLPLSPNSIPRTPLSATNTTPRRTPKPTPFPINNLTGLDFVYSHYSIYPIEKPFQNRCSQTKKDVKPKVNPINPAERLPTLVIYVFAETTPLKASNFNYFLQHGLCEDCLNLDFVIIINGATTSKSNEVPNHKNVLLLKRDNVCGDFGAWDYFFKLKGEEYMRKYKRIMFINDTVKGPFIDSNYLLFIKGLHFTDIYAAHINEETGMVGSYISCGGFWASTIGFSHVQTPAFMIDDDAFLTVRDLMICHKDRYDTIARGEIGISKRLLENNINIASLFYAYRGVDFRCNDIMRNTCNNNINAAMTDHKYFGIGPSITEVVFVKNTVDFYNKEIAMYTEWADLKSDFV